MEIEVITLFPEVIAAGTNYSILKRAQELGLVSIRPIQLRDYALDKHRTVDDAPYGGGAGMVIKADVVFRAVEDCLRKRQFPKARILLMEPQGVLLNQSLAAELAQEPYLLFICGHYEGVDARVWEGLATDVISIGDYVLTGGELPALVVIEAVVRLLPGALGAPESLKQDSFSDGFLGYPQYTRPEEFRGLRVPQVLLSGNHAAIARWRRLRQLQLTRQLRPDLFAKANLTQQDLKLLESAEKQDE